MLTINVCSLLDLDRLVDPLLDRAELGSQFVSTS